MVFLELGKYIGSLFRGHIFSRVPSVDINFSNFQFYVYNDKEFILLYWKLDEVKL